MSSKIAQIALYVVVAISILVIGFFYFGDNLIDVDAYETKIEKMNAPDDDFMSSYMMPQAVDTSAAESDSTALESEAADSLEDAAAIVETIEEPPVTVEEEEIKLTFMEKMVDNKTSIALIWAYILVLITLLVAVGFSLIQMFSNPSHGPL